MSDLFSQVTDNSTLAGRSDSSVYNYIAPLLQVLRRGTYPTYMIHPKHCPKTRKHISNIAEPRQICRWNLNELYRGRHSKETLPTKIVWQHISIKVDRNGQDDVKLASVAICLTFLCLAAKTYPPCFCF